MSQAVKHYKSSPRRTSNIRCIQAEIRAQGLTEEEYRTLYNDVTGKDSLRAMSLDELKQVVRRIKRDSTYKKPAPINGRDKTYKGVVLCQDPKARKIRSLWLELRDAGALKDSSEKALLAFVKRSTGIERMEWLQDNQLNNVIEQLKNWLGRL